MSSRALVSLGDDRILELDRIARARGVSRSAVIREAVDRIIAESLPDQDETVARHAAIDDAFGMWKGRADIGDAVEWQRRERAGWTRPWDPEYDEARAEFPDLFTADDDRERERYRS